MFQGDAGEPAERGEDGRPGVPGKAGLPGKEVLCGSRMEPATVLSTLLLLSAMSSRLNLVRVHTEHVER